MFRCHLRHFLIDGDGVLVGWAEFAARQPDGDAIVVVPERPGVVKAADRGDDTAVFFQRLEGAGKLVVFARLGDLVIERVHAVGQVDEGATPGRRGLFRRPERHHAFQERQGNGAAHGAQGVPSIEKPGL